MTSRRHKSSEADSSSRRAGRGRQVPPKPAAPERRDSPYPPLQWERWEIWALASISLLAIFLRFFRAGSKGFWIDEISTSAGARDILRPDFFRQVHFMAFLMVRLCLLLGHSELTLRLPSLVFSSASVPMIFLMLKRWFDDRRVAVLGALLAAVSLYQLHFAQEARYYGIMTFLSAWSMLILHRLLAAPAPLPSLVFVLVNLINFGVHPATAVFFGIQVLYWLGYASARGDAKRLYGRWRQIRAKPVVPVVLGHAAILAVCGLVFWFGYRYLFGGYLRMILRRCSEFPHWELTPAVGFNARFFLSPVYPFALLYGKNLGLSPLAGEAYSVLFGIGVAWGLFRHRWQTAFVALAYGLTYASLFVFKADIPYCNKYVIYLYPSWDFLVSLGCLAVSQGALRLARRAPGAWGVGLLAGALLAILQAAQYRDFHLFYTCDYEPYRSTLEYIRSRTPTGGILVTTPRAKPCFDCYRREQGFGGEKFYAGKVDLLPLWHALRLNDFVWFCPINVDLKQYPKEDLDRILQGFEDQGLSASYAGYQLDIPRYYAPRGRFVFPGQKRVYRVGIAERPAADSTEEAFAFRQDGNQEWTGRLSLCAAASAAYRLALEGGAGPADKWAGRAGSADGESSFRFHRRADGALVSAPFSIPEGPFSVELHTADAPSTPGLMAALCPEPGWIPARCFANATVCSSGRPITWQGREAYALLKTGTVAYEIDTEEGGPCQFGVEAVQDRPAPIEVEVAVNGAPQGILVFSKGDNAFGEEPFTAPLRRGLNRVDLTFLNAGSGERGARDLTDQDPDFIVRGIRYRPLRAGETPSSAFLPAQTYMPVSRELEDVSFGTIGPRPALNPFWQLIGGVKVALADEGKTARLAVSAEATFVGLAGRSAPVLPGRALYCSVRIKCENMLNHSANVVFGYYDASGKPLGQEFVYATGVTGSQDWSRFACFRVPPPMAKSASVGLVVYPNGTRPGKKQEDVWFSDFQFLPRSGFETPSSGEIDQTL